MALLLTAEISRNICVDPGSIFQVWDVILPVELASFTAQAGDNSVTLNWSTASETNVANFEIIRNGNYVGAVNATNAAHNYTWTDERALNGSTYSYTLVSVDMNGARKDLRTIEATPNANLARNHRICSQAKLSESFSIPAPKLCMI